MTTDVYLIDSSVWVRLFRRLPRPELAQRVDQILAELTGATNGVVKVEIMGGARNEGEFNDYQRTLDALIMFPISDGTWDDSARLGFRLRRLGVVPSMPDLVIAMTAIEHGAVLLHADSDFDRIAANSDLLVESYVNAAI